MMPPEIVDCPDSGKFGVRLQVEDASVEEKTVFRYIGRMQDMVDYWDGE